MWVWLLFHPVNDICGGHKCYPFNHLVPKLTGHICTLFSRAQCRSSSINLCHTNVFVCFVSRSFDETSGACLVRFNEECNHEEPIACFFSADIISIPKSSLPSIGLLGTAQVKPNALSQLFSRKLAAFLNASRSPWVDIPCCCIAFVVQIPRLHAHYTVPIEGPR